MGGQMTTFKRKILRCLILDWQMLYGYAEISNSQDEVQDKRSFVEENYQSLAKQRNECGSWKEFYVSYQYE